MSFSILFPFSLSRKKKNQAAAEHDYLLSLLSSILLHNIAYIHEHGDELPAGDVILISRRFVTPGLMDLISDHRSNSHGLP